MIKRLYLATKMAKSLSKKMECDKAAELAAIRYNVKTEEVLEGMRK